MLHHSSFQNSITLFHAHPNFFLEHFKTREIEILSWEHFKKLSKFFLKGVFFLKILRPPRSTLFPYTKLFLSLFHAHPNFFLEHFKTREIEILSCEHSIKLSQFFFKGVVGGKIFTYLECSITPLSKTVLHFSTHTPIFF